MDAETRLYLLDLAEGKALPVGTKRKWGGKEYEKQRDGEWKPVAARPVVGKAAPTAPAAPPPATPAKVEPAKVELHAKAAASHAADARGAVLSSGYKTQFAKNSATKAAKAAEGARSEAEKLRVKARETPTDEKLQQVAKQAAVVAEKARTDAESAWKAAHGTLPPAHLRIPVSGAGTKEERQMDPIRHERLRALAEGNKPQDVKPSQKNKPDQTNVDNWVRDVFLGMKGKVSAAELDAAIKTHGAVHGKETILVALKDLIKEKYVRKTKGGYEWPDQVALSRQPGFENEAVEKKTYAQAQQEILDYLSANSWKVKADLKIPHATSPDGSYRLWFKAQAVYFTDLKDPDRAQYGQSTSRHDYGDARTISYDLDLRTMTGKSFLTLVTQRLTTAGKKVIEQKRLMGFGVDRPSLGLHEAGLAPKTAADWQLYSDMPGSEDAAEELTKALAVAVGVLKADLKTAKSNDKKALAKLIGKVYKKYLSPVMDKHAELGATDTEPLGVAQQALIDVVKAHFDWSNYYMPELGDGM